MELLHSPDELNKKNHAGAHLLISNFGFRSATPLDAAVFDVLDRINEWKQERPPVLVFASPDSGNTNRKAVLRRGAWEYASGWSELFKLIELLFGRDVRDP